MSKKNLNKFAAVTLAATMVLGSTMAVYGAGTAEGSGSYEGGDLKYPTLSVTLPTIPAGTYDYIADPNGLIEETKNSDGTAAKYENSTFTGSTGVFFLTSTADDGAKTYTEKSAAQTVTNENAQDIDVTVKLEQKTAGDANIAYADASTFDSADTANKLYLAITDDASTDAKVSALSAKSAATLSMKVDGVPANYEAGYDATNGYGYTMKDEADLTDWNECSVIMTGAINKNATWGDEVTFPEITVTWSYAEHQDAYVSSSTVSASNSAVTLTLPSGVTVSSVIINKAAGGTVNCVAGTHYTLSGTTLTFGSGPMGNNVGGTVAITYSDGHVDTLAIQ